MTPNGVLRADLHLHSYYSGLTSHLRFLRARDCYSSPDSIYRVAKARGMDLVTITDHDSIDGCIDFLNRHPEAPDFFISEEIECTFPDVDLKCHVGAYGLTERMHRELQPLRANVFDVVGYLRAEGAFCALNHPFFFFRDQITLGHYLASALECFPGYETRNGTMLRSHNEFVQAIVDRSVERPALKLASVGGSDSHTLAAIGTTYTEAPGRSCSEFLDSLRAGRATVGGRHGSVWREAREIYGVTGDYWRSLLRGDGGLSPGRRVIGAAFSLISMPFEFIPLAVAALHKTTERRRVRILRRLWEMQNESSSTPSASTDIEKLGRSEVVP